MGGMGGAQPLAQRSTAARFSESTWPERIKPASSPATATVMVNDLDESLRILKNAVRKREPASVDWSATARPDPALAKRRHRARSAYRPDLVRTIR